MKAQEQGPLSTEETDLVPWLGKGDAKSGMRFSEAERRAKEEVPRMGSQ